MESIPRQPDAERPTTIHDVAKAAGVGVGTVSRVLNGGPVAPATRARIEAAMLALEFSPNAMARGVRASASGLVGCVVSDLANPLYAAIVDALEAGLRASGRTLVLANSGNDPQRELETVAALRRHRVDGLVIAPCTESGNAAVGSLRRAGVPFVVLDRDMDGAPADRVLIEHRPGVLAATRHLLGLGHRRIALVTPGAGLRPARERIRGYLDAHAERGDTADRALIVQAPSATSSELSAALELFEGSDPPTAVIVLGTRLLAGVLGAIRRTGRTVPGDVSVVSLGDTDLARYGEPALSALGWNLDEVGRACARLVVARLGQGGASDAAPARRELITTQLLLRDSTSTAPRRAPRHTGQARRGRLQGDTT